jgi:hypothetical protein
MVTFRDIDFEDIPRALRLAGSNKRTIDRNDLVSEIRKLEAAGIGPSHRHIDDFDISEFVGRLGVFTGADAPMLNLDLTSPAVAAQLTTVRASAGYAENLNNDYSLFANNLPRITNKGLLVEEARTNSLANNSMTGAVPGGAGVGTLPTGWTAFGDALDQSMKHQVVGVGSYKGVDYVDLRFFGTPVMGWFEVDFGPAPVAATPGQVWTGSMFGGLVAGKGPVFEPGSGYFMVFSAAGGASLLSSVLEPGGFGSWARRAVSATAPANTVSVTSGFFFRFPTPYVPYDFTFRIGWPQLELGAFATSPIRTTSAAVMRSSDNITLASFATLGFNAVEGSLFTEAFNSVFPADARPAELFGTNSTNIMHARHQLGVGVRLAVVTGGVAQVGVNTPNIAAINVPWKTAFAYKLNDFAAVLNGGIPVVDTVGTVPPATGLQIGAGFTPTQFLNGWLRRVAYWNQRLTNAQLQLLTGA